MYHSKSFLLQYSCVFFVIKSVYYLNKKILSLVIYAGYEDGDIAEKIHFFCNDSYLHNQYESLKKAF